MGFFSDFVWEFISEFEPVSEITDDSEYFRFLFLMFFKSSISWKSGILGVPVKPALFLILLLNTKSTPPIFNWSVLILIFLRQTDLR